LRQRHPHAYNLRPHYTVLGGRARLLQVALHRCQENKNGPVVTIDRTVSYSIGAARFELATS